MTHSPDHAKQGADVEGAIRIALWNACKARGMSQDGSIQLVAQTLADPALAAALRGRDAVVEWEVWQDDMPVATSTNEADARHYLMVYGQDGPATLMRVERTEVARAALHDAKEVTGG